MSQFPSTTTETSRWTGLYPGAPNAAEAAWCADAQGKFWAYHVRLYAAGPDASPGKLKGLATEVGLDLPAFEGCLSSGKYQATIKQDVEEAANLN